jgi:hypothetical protein
MTHDPLLIIFISNIKITDHLNHNIFHYTLFISKYKINSKQLHIFNHIN